MFRIKDYDCVHCRRRERKALWSRENFRLLRDDPDEWEARYEADRAAVLRIWEKKDVRSLR